MACVPLLYVSAVLGKTALGQKRSMKWQARIVFCWILHVGSACGVGLWDIWWGLTAAMLTQARAPSSLGKHMGRMSSIPIVVITKRLSARKLSSPADEQV